jgi:hypothetical protein
MFSTALAKEQSYLARGSSISIEDDTTTIQVSPNGAFSCGFYKVVTNAFTFSIWFSKSGDKTVTWTANRDAPVNGKGSKLVFQKDGRLTLLDYNGTAVWGTTTTHARIAQLLDTGNLVVMDLDGQHLWKSFDSPTDTLLPLQPMTRNTKLVSASARGLLYSGSYTFYFNSDNVLTLIYSIPDISNIYWPNPYYKPWENGRSTYNSSQFGVLDNTGRFVASDKFQFEASDLGGEVMRRLTLDYDGNLRLYSLDVTDGSWLVSWMAFPRNCEIHGLCGINSLCTYIPKLECSCIEGFETIEPGDWSKGCKSKSNMSTKMKRSKGSKGMVNSMANQKFSFRKLGGTDFWGYDFSYTKSLTLFECRNVCLGIQNCQAFGYQRGKGECFPKALLFNGKNFASPPNDIYLKVPNVSLSSPESDSRKTHQCKITEEVAYPSSPMLGGTTPKFKFDYFLSSVLTLLVIEVVLIVAG